MRSEIAAYYQQGLEEARLSSTPWGRLEFLRTYDLLLRELPAPPASVLDVGGGAGVYAGPLASLGYRVHVVDPMPEHVAAAGALPGVTAALGDARALTEADSTVDAVLMLGPLYHLTDRSDRVQAWREAARVVRPGGVVMAATISRYASMFDGFVKGYLREPAFAQMLEHTLTAGVHQNLGDGNPEWFTTAYFHLPDEAAAEAAEAGLSVSRVAMVEGPLWMLADRLSSFVAESPELMLDWLRRVEGEPGLLGSSSHLLTICRNPGAGPAGPTP